MDSLQSSVRVDNSGARLRMETVTCAFEDAAGEALDIGADIATDLATGAYALVNPGVL